MPPPQYFRRSQTYKSGKEAPDIFRLWLLRMLVPLGAHREFITQYGFKSDALAELLGLGRWVEGSDDADVESDTWSEDGSAISEKSTTQIFDPKRVRIELRRLYRTAERKASAGQLPQALRSNLERLASLVGLSAVDVSILEFAVMINSDGLLVETSEWLGNLSTVTLIAALSVVLGFLKPDQAWELFARQCHVFSIAPPEPIQRATLDRLTHLTPGDFATVARQHRFRTIESAAALLAALDGECALKQGARSGIGFV